eukprot:g16052.t1
MVWGRVFPSLASALLPLLLASSATASQFTTSAACNFTFSQGDLPNFRLPEAGPNSPGDVQLNVGNDIITRGWNESDVNGTLHSCNGDSSAYYVGDDTWNTTYISNDGDELEIDVFYATYQNQLWVRHLQPHMDPSLYNALNDTTIRLNITCGLVNNGCIEFTANFTEATPYNYTEPYDFQDDCSHGFSDGVRVPMVHVHAASPVGPASSASLGAGNTLILAGKADQGLPWSEGFNADGSRKDDEFWGDWWASINSRYNATESDDVTSTSDSAYTYLGCYLDTWEERIMSMVASNSQMDAEECSELCIGSRQFGTQFARECWCGPEDEDADYAQHGESTCDHECTGADSSDDDPEICGGGWAMSVYQYGESTIIENALASNQETACTGGLAQAWDPRTGEWRSTFETLDSQSHDIDMFYLNQVDDGMNELWVTEIEDWMAPSLYNQLQYNYVKLSITCPDENVVTESCVIFMPTFTNWSPEIDGAQAGYRFADPALPSFDLPEAVPNSPGDVVLTTGNSVVTKTGAATETYCNGDSAEYYGEDGMWYSEFVKADGDTHELKHVFYPTQRNLYAATIQSVWEPNLRGILFNRTVRLTIWCTNDERAQYLFFRVSGEEATCEDIDDLCSDVEEAGALQLTPTFSQCAATLSAAYLGWLSA